MSAFVAIIPFICFPGQDCKEYAKNIKLWRKRQAAGKPTGSAKPMRSQDSKPYILCMVFFTFSNQSLQLC